MTTYNTLAKATTKLITSAGALALIAGLNISTAPQAYADDCLLDTNNDGNADSNVDTDGGADSGGVNNRLACGQGASATGSFSTAVGAISDASGDHSTALGRNAIAAGEDSTALGRNSSAAGSNSTAVGRDASAAGPSSTALGYSANAAGNSSTAVGHSASAAGSSTALGREASAAGSISTAVGHGASATGSESTALGGFASAVGDFSTALGVSAQTDLAGTTSVGYAANNGIAVGANSTALGYRAKTQGTNAIAIGADTGDGGFIGASAQGNDSIVIGADASDGAFAGAIVIGMGADATEADQVILKDAATFTILGNGNMGVGTATPAGNLDIDSGGAVDTTLLLSNTAAQWEIKNKANTGRLNFKNLIAGGVPFKLGPTAVNSLLSVGTATMDLVEVRGDLDVTGILTTGGPTCGGGCDAVFNDDYDLPTIEEHAREMFANKHLPAVGPTVPLAPLNVSETIGNMLNELEKAHIYIAQNHREKQAMQAEMAQMKQQIAILMAK